MLFGKKKRGPPPDQPELRCSFCNKSQYYVKKLIAGPNVQICDECVDICLDIVAEDRTDGKAAEEPRSWPLTAGSVCTLCGLPMASETALLVDGRGALCPGCVNEIRAALGAV